MIAKENLGFNDKDFWIGKLCSILKYKLKENWVLQKLVMYKNCLNRTNSI